MRGRKPASIVAGNSPIESVPKAPVWLSKEAKAEWCRVAPILHASGVLDDTDLGVLQSYCMAIGTMQQAQRLLNKEGLVTEAGKRHPAVGIMNAAQQTMRLCATELGLTPVSRSRPAIRSDNDRDDAPNPLDIS